MTARSISAEDRIQAEDSVGQSDTLRALQQEARAAGLFVPHLPPVMAAWAWG
ncbi:MAG: hypothetical protein RMK29_00800 [Myxococcales bacterium]|nr:hypothetical protein [Myxococcota bacterium]MDW8280216.1 hypothetical protein [Myxococcales bacterium]